MQILGIVLPVLFAACVVTALDSDQQWKDFVLTYNKQYTHAGEEMYRRQVWNENIRYIETHNTLAKQGANTFFLAQNRFADMTHDEFLGMMTGLRMRNGSRSSHARFSFPRDKLRDLPETVDWRDEGYVTPIKDQGQCGACWAFSSTGALEGQWFKKTGKLIPLSEQNLVDCSKNYNIGCEGGLMEYAFDWIKSNGGLNTEEAYPYEAKDGECRFNKVSAVAPITGFVTIEPFDEEGQKVAVAEVGPVSVAIDASQRSFQFYSGGIYEEPGCSPMVLNHAVLAIGYGTEGGQDYWLMKNSWGRQWGDDGYLKIARNRDNMCGIATDSSYPTV